MEVHYNSAFPSLLFLVILFFLPLSARQSHSRWRALQAYDKQKPSDDVAISTGQSILGLILYWIPLSFTILLLVDILVTSGLGWHNRWPLLATLIDAVPCLFLIVVVILATSSLIPIISNAHLAVHRIRNVKQSDISVVCRDVRRSESTLAETIFKRRYKLAISGILSLVIVWVAPAINQHSALLLCMMSISVLMIVLLNPEPIVLGRYASFRGFIIIPVLITVHYALMQLLYLVIAYGIMALLKIAKYDVDSWKAKTFTLHLSAYQLMILLVSYLYSFATWFPCALIVLAYRYDMAQNSQSTLSEDQMDELVLQSPCPQDSSGRTPILLNQACLSPPSSKSNLDQLPTFKIAFYTMVAIQVFGLLVDTLTGWQPGIYYPTAQDQIFTSENGFSINVWPVVAYPFIIISMIISVQYHPNRNFTSLWSFHEKWDIDSTASTTPKFQDIEVELQGLAKEPDQDWISVVA